MKHVILVGDLKNGRFQIGAQILQTYLGQQAVIIGPSKLKEVEDLINANSDGKYALHIISHGSYGRIMLANKLVMSDQFNKKFRTWKLKPCFLFVYACHASPEDPGKDQQLPQSLDKQFFDSLPQSLGKSIWGALQLREYDSKTDPNPDITNLTYVGVGTCESITCDGTDFGTSTVLSFIEALSSKQVNNTTKISDVCKMTRTPCECNESGKIEDYAATAYGIHDGKTVEELFGPKEKLNWGAVKTAVDSQLECARKSNSDVVTC